MNKTYRISWIAFTFVASLATSPFTHAVSPLDVYEQEAKKEFANHAIEAAISLGTGLLLNIGSFSPSTFMIKDALAETLATLGYSPYFNHRARLYYNNSNELNQNSSLGDAENYSQRMELLNKIDPSVIYCAWIGSCGDFVQEFGTSVVRTNAYLSYSEWHPDLKPDQNRLWAEAKLHAIYESIPLAKAALLGPQTLFLMDPFGFSTKTDLSFYLSLGSTPLWWALLYLNNPAALVVLAIIKQELIIEFTKGLAFSLLSNLPNSIAIDSSARTALDHVYEVLKGAPQQPFVR